jgi:hypothetical protein
MTVLSALDGMKIWGVDHPTTSVTHDYRLTFMKCICGAVYVTDLQPPEYWASKPGTHICPEMTHLRMIQRRLVRA